MSEPTTSTNLVSVRGLTKSYAGVHALKGADLELAAGEIHGLVGENGAGKSTLIKILTGLVQPDGGEVVVQGKEVQGLTVAESERLGIAVVHQESTAFRDLGAVDNIFVGREIRQSGGLLLDRRRMRDEAKTLLKQLEEDLPLNVPLGEFSVAQQQMVAIARALSLKSKVVILDEPTASLSEKEAVVLHQTVRRLREQRISVLLVSHRLEEVLDLCDRVTVLRDGTTVAVKGASDWTRATLIQSMIGREVSELSSSSRSAGDIVLEVKNLSRKGAYQNVSFQVRSGEIVGLGGLVGAGRTEVVRAAFGVDRADSGEIQLMGQPLSAGSIQKSMAHGIALVPEDRQHQGLVLQQAVGANLMMAVRSRLAKAGWIDRKSENTQSVELVRTMAIKAKSPQVAASSLSGGNQQKVVLGKWLATKPRLLILDEPTRGVDIGSKLEIHRLIQSLAAEGTAVLLVSSDMPELISLSHRIVVLSAGHVTGVLTGDEMSSERVLNLAFGAAK